MMPAEMTVPYRILGGACREGLVDDPSGPECYYGSLSKALAR